MCNSNKATNEGYSLWSCRHDLVSPAALGVFLEFREQTLWHPALLIFPGGLDVLTITPRAAKIVAGPGMTAFSSMAVSSEQYGHFEPD